MAWPAAASERFAGVSAFGFSGTNAHVIVRDYETPAAAEPLTDRPLHVLALSAKNQQALLELAHRYRVHLETGPADKLADVCCTANAGRSHFEHRLALVVESRAETLEQLRKVNDGPASAPLLKGPAASLPRIAFLFTGQGSQYAGMGRELYDTQPTFRRTLDQCDAILRRELNRSIVSVLYGSGMSSPALDETSHTQPILFSLEYSLARLWQTWGIEPVAVIGHSIGEYVAAVIAGVFGLEDALKLVAARGRLMGSLPSGGAMCAVLADESTVSSAIREHASDVSIAAINGPSNTVISGANAQLEQVVASLRARGINSRRLNVSHAFHSPLMEPVLSGFRALASEIQYASPRIALVSNVFGRIVTDEMTSADYWVRQLREPVRFAQGIGALAREKIGVCLEVGPAPVLLALTRQCLQHEKLQYLPTMSPGQSNWRTLLTSLAALYTNGAPIDWKAFDSDYRRQRVALPTYPFQRQMFWIESSGAPRQRAARESVSSSTAQDPHPLLGRRLHLAHSNGAIFFESSLADRSPAFLGDHRIHETVIAPGAAFVEMAVAAATRAARRDEWEITNLSFEKGLVLTARATTVQLTLLGGADGRFSFEILSARTDDQPEPTWVTHATGFLASPPHTTDWARVDLSSIQARCTGEIPVDVFYATCRQRGIDYGASFRALRRAWLLGDGAVGQVTLDGSLTAQTHQYTFHPALLDACLQPLGLLPEISAAGDAWIPLGIERLIVLRQAGTEAWSYIRPRMLPDASGTSGLHLDALVYAPDGRLLAVVENLHVGRTNANAFEDGRRNDPKDWFYDVQWRPRQLDKSSQYTPVRPGPGEIKERLVAELPGIVESRPVLESYLEGFSALEEAGFLFVLDAFHELGASLHEGDSFTTAELASRLKIAHKHERLFGRLLEVLEAGNRLRLEGERWIVPTTFARGNAGIALRETRSRYPAIEAEAALLARCG
jgi:acyl transferase domain-containing protein